MPFAIRGEAKGPYPVPLQIFMSCDGDHGFLPVSEVFPIAVEHPYDPPMRAGWKFSADGPVYCPCCARNRRAPDADPEC